MDSTTPLTFYLVVNSFLNKETGEPVLGGTETYTASLVALAAGRHGRTVVLQRSGNFINERVSSTLTVHSWKTVAELRRKLADLRRIEKGIVFLYEAIFIPEASELPCVLVHHGIGSDGTADPPNRPSLLVKLADLRRRCRWYMDAVSLFRIYSAFTRVICVDTNIINQMRYCHPMYDWSRHLVYVPNFSRISPEANIRRKWEKFVPGAGVVLFARRFVIQRGFYLWTDCVRSLPERS